MENKKLMWIDSKWDLFLDMIIGNTMGYLWNNGIDSDVTFINCYDDKTAYLLDEFLVEEFMKVYTDARDNEKSVLIRNFLRQRIMNIRINNNHFSNSTVVPYMDEYSAEDVLSRIKNPKDRTYLLRMDLLHNEREDLLNGVDKTYLSMGLYYFITKVFNCPCLLYTEESMNVEDNWKNIYRKYFEDKEAINCTNIEEGHGLKLWKK